jgi:hypothetical protein
MKKYKNDMIIDTERLIESMITQYIDDLNLTTGLKYKFISRKIWNPHRHGLNYSHDNSPIGSGHCVITTTLLFHYIGLTNANIAETFVIVGGLKSNETIELINGYSVGIMQYI